MCRCCMCQCRLHVMDSRTVPRGWCCGSRCGWCCGGDGTVLQAATDNHMLQVQLQSRANALSRLEAGVGQLHELVVALRCHEPGLGVAVDVQSLLRQSGAGVALEDASAAGAVPSVRTMPFVALQVVLLWWLQCLSSRFLLWGVSWHHTAVDSQWRRGIVDSTHHQVHVADVAGPVADIIARKAARVLRAKCAALFVCNRFVLPSIPRVWFPSSTLARFTLSLALSRSFRCPLSRQSEHSPGFLLLFLVALRPPPHQHHWRALGALPLPLWWCWVCDPCGFCCWITGLIVACITRRASLVRLLRSVCECQGRVQRSEAAPGARRFADRPSELRAHAGRRRCEASQRHRQWAQR